MRELLVMVALVGVAGCGPKRLEMPPEARLIYHVGDSAVWTFCDRKHRIYMSSAGDFSVLKDECPDNRP